MSNTFSDLWILPTDTDEIVRAVRNLLPGREVCWEPNCSLPTLVFGGTYCLSIDTPNLDNLRRAGDDHITTRFFVEAEFADRYTSQSCNTIDHLLHVLAEMIEEEAAL